MDFVGIKFDILCKKKILESVFWLISLVCSTIPNKSNINSVHSKIL